MCEKVSSSPRSVLYSLKPIGIGSEMVESLTSYLTRLSCEHNTTVGNLMNKLLFPIMDKGHLLRSSDFGGNRFYEGAKTVNGYTEYSNDVVNNLEKLNSRNDLKSLTLWKLRDVIPLRGLLKKQLTWCPYCIKEWIDNNKPVYYPLNWYLEVVKVCNKHSCYLKDTCPSCHRKQDILRRDSIIGICHHCFERLDKYPEKNKENNEWQSFVNRSIGLLLNCEEKAPFVFRSYLVDNLNSINEEVFEERLSNFGIQLNFAKNTVSGWLKGDVTPTLENQLYICYRLNIDIEQLLFKPIDLTKVQILEDKKIKGSVLHKDRRKLEYQFIQKQLEDILQNERAISMEAAAEKIGVNKRTLYRNFRDLCIKISNKYKEYLEERKAQRINNLKFEIESTFNLLREQGVYPSRRKMEQNINKPGLLKEKELQNHWKGLFLKNGFSN